MGLCDFEVSSCFPLCAPFFLIPPTLQHTAFTSHFHIIVCASTPDTGYVSWALGWIFIQRKKQASKNMAAEQEEEVEKRSLDEKSVRLYNITSWKMLCIDCRVWCDGSHPKLSSSYPSIRLQSELYVCCYILESLVSNGYIRVVDMSATLGIGLDTEIFYCSHCRLSYSSAILAYSSRSIF